MRGDDVEPAYMGVLVQESRERQSREARPAAAGGRSTARWMAKLSGGRVKRKATLS